MDMNGGSVFLPEDITINILKRLPVNSLLRFQCVCKDWNILVNTPCFIRHHLLHSSLQNPSLLVSSGDPHDPFYSLSFSPDAPFHGIHIPPLHHDPPLGLSLVGSTNGILCFRDFSDVTHPPILWNPATREFRRIPIITSHDDDDLVWNFGFGFSPVVDDYRIVRFIYRLSSHSHLLCKVQVFSLSTGLWRDIESDNIKHVFLLGCAVSTAGGVLFWRGSTNINHTRDVIVSFDIATQVFKLISWPDFVPYGGKLAVCDGKLAIISYSRDMYFQYYHLEGVNGGISLCFSVMGEDERWSSSKTYTSNLGFCFCDGIIWRDQIVCIDWSNLTFADRGMENNECLYLIDVDAHECKQFGVPRHKFGYSVCVFNYVESLVPISANTRIEEV